MPHNISASEVFSHMGNIIKYLDSVIWKKEEYPLQEQQFSWIKSSVSLHTDADITELMTLWYSSIY